MAALPVNDDERKIGQMVAPATISIMEVTVATSRERVAAHRARRRKSLVQITAAISESDLKEIAGAGYPDVKSDDRQQAALALGLFISDTVACLDTEDTVPRVAQQGCNGVHPCHRDRRCGATQSSGSSAAPTSA